MSWFKYIFHRHRWYYFGKFPDQYIFKCEICRRDKKVKVVASRHYTKEKIDKIQKIMNDSVNHLTN